MLEKKTYKHKKVPWFKVMHCMVMKQENSYTGGAMSIQWE